MSLLTTKIVRPSKYILRIAQSPNTTLKKSSAVSTQRMLQVLSQDKRLTKKLVKCYEIDEGKTLGKIFQPQ